MEIHPTVTDHELTPDDVYTAVRGALITTHIGNGPTRLLIVGATPSGRLLELTAVVKHEDVLVVHAADARPDHLGLVDEAGASAPDSSPSAWGRSADNQVLTDEVLKSVFEEAEAGHDVARLATRVRPGRPAPLTVGTTIRLGLDPELRRSLTSFCAAGGHGASDVIIRSLQDYLAATP